MSGAFVAFFVISLMAIGGAVFMINFARVTHMVIALAFTFLSMAGLYILLEAPFVAVTQVLVYAGAVSILMLFGIMLTHHDASQEEQDRGSMWHKGGAFVLVALLFVTVFWGIQGTSWNTTPAQLAENNTFEIGSQLFTNYVIPFEMVSVLLLVALVGAIILAKREADDE